MLKFTNNASATLAGAITASATSIILTSGNGSLFPALNAGEFFYATLVDSSNNLEVVKVTGRTTDTLTVVRAQDGTVARAYAVGDKCELRLVAAVFSEMIQRDGSVVMTAALNHGGFKATNVADPTAAQDAATKNYVDTTAVAAVNAEATTRANADAAEVTARTNAISAEATARANADALLLAKAGDTMTGTLRIQNTAPTIELYDTDQGVTKKVHHNSGLIGFLSDDTNWLLYGNNGGQIWSRTYGWLHDYFFSSVDNCARSVGQGYNAQWQSAYTNCTSSTYLTAPSTNAGNCFNGSNCNTVLASNCGSVVSYATVLLDNGASLGMRTYAYAYNCNCNCC